MTTATNDKSEQFYRDTESIAFPKIDDRQLAMLEPLGRRRTLHQGEMLFRSGERDFPLAVVLSGEVEAYEARDGTELILATLGPRDFVGDVAMLNGTSALASARGKAAQSEILEIPAEQLRRALADLPGVGEPVVQAFITRRERIRRRPGFAGIRIVAQSGSREGHRIDDFLDKNHIPHRLIDFGTEESTALCAQVGVVECDLPVLVAGDAKPTGRFRNGRIIVSAERKLDRRAACPCPPGPLSDPFSHPLARLRCVRLRSGQSPT
jgi:thioredoxin reductase (NADPH)